jgi:hypothetical protein
LEQGDDQQKSKQEQDSETGQAAFQATSTGPAGTSFRMVWVPSLQVTTTESACSFP